MLSDRGLPDFPRLYRSVRCCLLLVQKHRPVPTFNYFPAQSLHFRYGSAAPYPTLRADVTTLLPRTRYGRLATPYPTGLPCCVLPAYKDCSRSQWKTAYAVFSVRTMLLLYHLCQLSFHFFALLYIIRFTDWNRRLWKDCSIPACICS